MTFDSWAGGGDAAADNGLEARSKIDIQYQNRQLLAPYSSFWLPKYTMFRGKVSGNLEELFGEVDESAVHDSRHRST